MPRMPPISAYVRLATSVVAFSTGGLLAFMVLLNGTVAAHGGALFSSWAAHGTGAVAATLFLAVLSRGRGAATQGTAPGAVPLWAYLGGISGAVTVMCTSFTLNSALALSGTLALGLVGQVAFGLAADRWGLFGLPRRRPGARDLAALALILVGSALIIFSGRIGALMAGGGA